jgi:peptidoglycan/xylan/chitin deacetylase (PgdA/CDA1 family)
LTNDVPIIPVVCYHSIGPVNKNWNRSFLTLELPFFEDQLRYINKHFQTLFLKEYWRMRSHQQPLIKNPIVLTFDDGFLDNWIWAYPLLKKYQLKATIFVCPEFVDLGDEHRPNLEDYWNKTVSVDEITRSGYLNWPEMTTMISSGLVDIQSHTMSHTKYFTGGKITGFHHPGNDCLYPVGNLFPRLKPYHISDPTFEMQIPYGYPLFEATSSVIAKRIKINDSFNAECVDALKPYDFTKYSFHTAFNEVKHLYQKYQSGGTLITETETDAQMETRLNYEILESKRILEEKLNIPIEFLCWPHGDNDDRAHQLAIAGGYLATTTGSKIKALDTADRIPERIGLWHVKRNRMLSLLKTRYKIESSRGLFPYKQVKLFYNLARYGRPQF